MENMEKQLLREEICRQRDRLNRFEIVQKSTAITEKLYRLPVYRASYTVMYFLSFRSEVDTRAMIMAALAEGKRVLVPKALPRTRELLPSQLTDWERDLAPGAYGIPEPREEALIPVDPAAVELLVVPGVAFDEQGNRLGYGGGYYDRFFKRIAPETPLVALAFELQIVDSVPVQPWDRPVDLIVTERRLIETQARGRRLFHEDLL
jgi:5-formyltetrahydrofolate cyclo-ligase